MGWRPENIRHMPEDSVAEIVLCSTTNTTTCLTTFWLHKLTPDGDEDGDEEWYHEQHPEDNAGKHQDEESVIKTGYLWKKGERRKVSGLNLLMFMPPEMSVRLGRNGGLYFGLLNLPSTNLLRSISYCGFWIFPMFTLAPPSN